MKKYVIDIKQEEYFNAGFKAKIDVDEILSREGFETKFLIVKEAKKMTERINNIKNAYKQLKIILKDMENNSILFFQYPIDLISNKFSKLIKKISKKKNIKTICLIHDINALHNINVLADIYYKKMGMEIKFFDSFDYLISHNESMTKYLTSNGISENKITNLGIFDYIIESEPKINSKKYNKIIIAGNLSKWKSGYVYLLHELNNNKYNFELFGSEYMKEKTKFINYNGSFKSDELPKHINFGFGLVWDGKSIDKISGSFGEYLKFNNPHKFSLYMATGIPVIVWKKSALSKFVEENKVGFSVNSLYELENIFKNMTNDDYKSITENVKKIQSKVIHGKYLVNAVNQILNKMEK